MRLLNALKGQNHDCPPIWIMRQAGRYLPSYQRLRAQHSLKDLFRTSELAAEVTLLPLKELNLDAAIVFSDILVVAEMLGLHVHFPEGKAPYVEPAVHPGMTLTLRPAKEVLGYVKQTIEQVIPQLNVPLIGFCGGPFTVASYLIERGHKETLGETKRWMLTEPESFHALLQKITTASIDYLQMQIEAGAQVIQIFDSWAHVLAPAQFEAFSLAYLKEITSALSHKFSEQFLRQSPYNRRSQVDPYCINTNQFAKPAVDDSSELSREKFHQKLVRQGTRQIHSVPVILFCRGSCYRAQELASASPTAISFDWQRDLKAISNELPPSIAIQGNLDPDLLRGDKDILKREACILLDSMRDHPGYIFNLGHGILPDTPVDHVKMLIDLVHREKR